MEKNLTPAQQAQLLTPAVRRIMDALHAAGGEARVVGGAVRDVLMGRAAGDIDLAASLQPARVMDILQAADIKTVPTGLAHGTITAVIDHTGFEITTLRRDIATDGRHAEIAFTDDWQTDAARRDFTFNALYADAEGRLYDYVGGIADAEKGRVRFIGDARARIAEDVLRILRFFRFYAWFGKGAADESALAACRDQAQLMPRLSAERIARETLKLLAAPDPLPAWRLMIQTGVTQHFLPEATNIVHVQNLLTNEAQFAEPPQALTRLAALLPPDASIAANIAARLKLAKRDGEKLVALACLPASIDTDISATALRRLLYRHGTANIRAALFLAGHHFADLLPVIAAWDAPTFPIKGEDIVRLGIPAGVRVGAILRAAEQDWIASDFSMDCAACLAAAKQHGKIH